MGKRLKGKSRPVEQEKKKKNLKPIELSNFPEIKAAWDRQAGRIKDMIQREHDNTRINQRLVTNNMRAQLRREKLSDLHDEVAICAQEHQREMDRKDSIVQTLQGRLGEVEDQFLMLQRSHSQKLDILDSIHKTKLRQLEADFERDLKIVKNEFNAEREYMERNHDRMKKELNAIIKQVKDKNLQNVELAKTNHETIREEIKNKNLEQINELRINLENKIEELDKKFDEAHIAYVERTKKKNEEFTQLQKHDKEFTQDNRRTKRKITKLHKTLTYMKHEIEMNRKECNSRNKILREQRDLVAQHCRDLKARMAKLREGEKKRLIELTVRSKRAQKKNENYVFHAERILKLMEAARKMETEREKVLPFYESKLPEEEKESAMKQSEAFVEDIKSKAATSDLVEWKSLQNFHKKYNKVLLDKLAIEQEKFRLQKENQDLRGVLQQYLDRIAITEDAVENNNSLLIVNGRADAPQQVKRVGRVTTVDANHVVTGYARQGAIRSKR